jgi:hypothetical protein
LKFPCKAKVHKGKVFLEDIREMIRKPKHRKEIGWEAEATVTCRCTKAILRREWNGNMPSHIVFDLKAA